MARVSSPANKNNVETAPRLLAYLIKHKHWSPFEMANMCVNIETTRDIGRQLIRHRSFTVQEFSQRYAIASEFETSEARMQDMKNRQNSLETDDYFVKTWWEAAQKRAISDANMLYNQALDQGIAKEQARKLLPEGLTKSYMHVNGTLRSWIHYCELRTGPETQKEHRELAQQCFDILKTILPSIYMEKT